MKMNKRLLSILIIVVTLLLVVVAFASCGKKCDHEWKEWKEDKAATCLENGEKTRECKYCSEEDHAVIEKIPHNFENYTTDTELFAKMREGTEGFRSRRPSALSRPCLHSTQNPHSQNMENRSRTSLRRQRFGRNPHPCGQGVCRGR